MRVLTKEEFNLEKQEHLYAIEKGAVFIHPTDTIYGLGCSATNPEAVSKLREIKKRPKTPFSIIAPSKEWIEKNCIVNEDGKSWLDKLPGPYTLVFKLRNTSCIAKEQVSPETDSLGIRMPEHWITEVVAEMGKPIVTTSVNESGTKFMTSREDIEPDIESRTHFMIDEGEMSGSPSTVVYLDEEEISIRERK